jgi:uncharacterized protein YqeY
MQEQIRAELTKAMKERNELTLRVLRRIIASITNELVSKGKKPQEKMTDEEVIAVIKKMVKQGKDSIEQFSKGGRNDLVENEQNELNVLERYLPQMMSEEKIKELAIAKKDELGVVDKSKAGILVGAVLKETKGSADGQIVKKIVDSLF